MSGDYSACENKECRLRMKCYRYMMERSPIQTFGGFKLEFMVSGSCIYEACHGFSALRPGDVLRKFDAPSN